jgi:hypothetical protein
VIPVVLLDGNLSMVRLAKALNEIKVLADYFAGISIVIRSTAGDAVASVCFVEEVLKLKLKLQVKIYEASSTASYIALAISNDREMCAESTLSIHRGEIRLSPSQISPEDKIDETLAKSFRRYDRELIKALKSSGLSRYTDELYATDWFRLSAVECLHLNIVQRLF